VNQTRHEANSNCPHCRIFFQYNQSIKSREVLFAGLFIFFLNKDSFMNTGLQNQDVYYELDSLSKLTDQA